MNYYEISDTQFDDFRREFFRRSSLPSRIVHIRKMSQDNHVRRMKLAYQKNHLTTTDDVYSSTSRFSLRKSVNNLKTSFTNTKVHHNALFRNYSEKNLNSSMKERHAILMPPNCSSDDEKYSYVTSSGKDIYENSQNSDHYKGTKSDCCVNEQSSSKSSPIITVKSESKLQKKALKKSQFTNKKAKQKHIVTTILDKHTDSEINKDDTKNGIVISIADSIIKKDTPKSKKQCNVSDSSNKIISYPKEGTNESKENAQKHKSKNSKNSSIRMDIRFSKIPVPNSRLSLYKDRRSLPLSSMCESYKAKNKFTSTPMQKLDKKVNSESKAFPQKPKTKHTNKTPSTEKKRPLCQGAAVRGIDLSKPNFEKQSKNSELQLENMSDKMSSVSLWLESIDTNNTEYIKGLDEADLLSEESNEKSSATHIKSSKSSFKNEAITERFVFDVEEVGRQKSSSKLSEQSAEYYYDLDNAKDCDLEKKDRVLYENNTDEWKNDFYDELSTPSSVSLFDSKPTVPRKETKMEGILKQENKETPNYPYNLRLPRYKAQMNYCDEKQRSGADDAKTKTDAAKKKPTTSTPKKKKAPKSKKTQKSKK